MKIKNRQQFLIILAVAGLVLLGLDRLVLEPLSRLWRARSARVAELQNSIQQGALLLDREQTIRQRWQFMRTNTLPTNLSAGETQVFTAFDRWSRQSGISISSIKPQWRSTDENYMTLECQTDGFGNIEAVTRFLYAAAKGPPALRVQAIEIAARDNAGQQLGLTLQVSGLVLQPPSLP